MTNRKSLEKNVFLFNLSIFGKLELFVFLRHPLFCTFACFYLSISLSYLFCENKKKKQCWFKKKSHASMPQFTLNLCLLLIFCNFFLISLKLWFCDSLNKDYFFTMVSPRSVVNICILLNTLLLSSSISWCVSLFLTLTPSLLFCGSLEDNYIHWKSTSE